MFSLKKKEDALLRKRIDKDKAKHQLAKIDQRVENFRNELAGLEFQAEESRQRVLVLQSDWQALYDKAGEESDAKDDAQPCQAPRNRMTWMTPVRTRCYREIRMAFLTVLSRTARKKHQRSASVADDGDGVHWGGGRFDQSFTTRLTLLRPAVTSSAILLLTSLLV